MPMQPLLQWILPGIHSSTVDMGPRNGDVDECVCLTTSRAEHGRLVCH